MAVAEAQIAILATALEMFKADNGHFPKGASGLQDLVVKPGDAGREWHQYMYEIPKDPWGHDYIYQFPGKHAADSFDIVSMGPDGRLGTRDDIMISK